MWITRFRPADLAKQFGDGQNLPLRRSNLSVYSCRVATALEEAMRMHKSITVERVAEAVERSQTSLDDPGFCLSCGLECDGVEPDAEGYCCEACGEHAVMGAEQILIGIM